MSEMVRKQIYISRRQQSLLKRLSKQRDLSEAEIIRQAIDREADHAITRSQLLRQEAWEKAYQFMLSLDERASKYSKPYQWNREELYEERLSRYLLRDRPATDAEEQP
jgi:hypothetical protein